MLESAGECLLLCVYIFSGPFDSSFLISHCWSVLATDCGRLLVELWSWLRFIHEWTMRVTFLGKQGSSVCVCVCVLLLLKVCSGTYINVWLKAALMHYIHNIYVHMLHYICTVQLQSHCATIIPCPALELHVLLHSVCIARFCVTFFSGSVFQLNPLSRN